MLEHHIDDTSKKISFILKKQDEVWDVGLRYDKEALKDMTAGKVTKVYNQLEKDLNMNENTKLLMKRLKEGLGEEPNTMHQLRKIKNQNAEINKKELDDMFDDVEEFDVAKDNEDFEPKKRELTKQEENEVDIYNRGKGMQDIKYDGGETPEFKKRNEKNMGEMKDKLMDVANRRADNEKNAKNPFHVTLTKEGKQSPETSSDEGFNEKKGHVKPFEGKPMKSPVSGNVVPVKETDAEDEEPMVEQGPETKSDEGFEKKKGHVKPFKGKPMKSPVSGNVVPVKEQIKLKSKVKLSEGNISDVLPKKYKVDGANISMSDGKNLYEFIWRGDYSGKPEFKNESDCGCKQKTNENAEFKKINHLTEFNATELIDPKKTINENENEYFLNFLQDMRKRESKK